MSSKYTIKIKEDNVKILEILTHIDNIKSKLGY